MPPKDSSALCSEAIDLALNGKWDAAHTIVQELNGELPAWIHAVLHKIEGDLGNSQYWYRRASRPFTENDSRTELLRIQETLQSGA
jgi:hypothetical protein